MLVKVIVGIVVVVVSVVAFGMITGKGEPPPFLTLVDAPQSQIIESSCPDTLVLETPVDLNKVTSILYPGQTRGGDFKPHGGFRFDSSKFDEIEVRVPLDGIVVEGVRYIENEALQYMFDFQNDCGIRYRFDHLVILSPKLTDVAKDLPEAKVNDTRTYSIDKEITFSKGEIIATAVGYKDNVFVDLGVYDLRGKNLNQNPRPYAVCWFDWLNDEDEKIVRSLPSGSSESGKNSTLCR